MGNRKSKIPAPVPGEPAVIHGIVWRGSHTITKKLQKKIAQEKQSGTVERTKSSNKIISLYSEPYLKKYARSTAGSESEASVVLSEAEGKSEGKSRSEMQLQTRSQSGMSELTSRVTALGARLQDGSSVEVPGSKEETTTRQSGGQLNGTAHQNPVSQCRFNCNTSSWQCDEVNQHPQSHNTVLCNCDDCHTVGNESVNPSHQLRMNNPGSCPALSNAQRGIRKTVENPSVSHPCLVSCPAAETQPSKPIDNYPVGEEQRHSVISLYSSALDLDVDIDVDVDVDVDTLTCDTNILTSAFLPSSKYVNPTAYTADSYDTSRDSYNHLPDSYNYINDSNHHPTTDSSYNNPATDSYDHTTDSSYNNTASYSYNAATSTPSTTKARAFTQDSTSSSASTAEASFKSCSSNETIVLDSAVPNCDTLKAFDVLSRQRDIDRDRDDVDVSAKSGSDGDRDRDFGRKYRDVDIMTHSETDPGSHQRSSSGEHAKKQNQRSNQSESDIKFTLGADTDSDDEVTKACRSQSQRRYDGMEKQGPRQNGEIATHRNGGSVAYHSATNVNANATIDGNTRSQALQNGSPRHLPPQQILQTQQQQQQASPQIHQPTLQQQCNGIAAEHLQHNGGSWHGITSKLSGDQGETTDLLLRPDTLRVGHTEDYQKFINPGTTNIPDHIRGTTPEVPLDHIPYMDNHTWRHFDYPFENLTFSGGGVKGYSFMGSLAALDDCGLLGKAVRVSGSSAGAICAGLVATGCSPQEVADFFAGDIKWLFHDQKCACCCCLPKICNRYGVHPAKRFHRIYGQHLAKKVGNPDITFGELYHTYGRELCIVVTNLSKMCSEYCHPKTTPDLPIRKAVRMSMSFPMVYQAVKANINGQESLYTDGGTLDQYPVHCFDGPDLELNHNSETSNKPATTPETPVETNMKTLGLYVVSESAIDYKIWKALFGADIPYKPSYLPDTKLSRQRLEEEFQRRCRKHKNLTMKEFLAELKAERSNHEEPMFHYETCDKSAVDIRSFKQYFITTIETLLISQRRLHIRPEDVHRTVAINCGYIGTNDYLVEPGDREFMIRQGYECTRRFLQDYVTKQQAASPKEPLPSTNNSPNPSPTTSSPFSNPWGSVQPDPGVVGRSVEQVEAAVRLESPAGDNAGNKETSMSRSSPDSIDEHAESKEILLSRSMMRDNPSNKPSTYTQSSTKSSTYPNGSSCATNQEISISTSMSTSRSRSMQDNPTNRDSTITNSSAHVNSVNGRIPRATKSNYELKMEFLYGKTNSGENPGGIKRTQSAVETIV